MSTSLRHKLTSALAAPADIASLAALRFLFGATLFVGLCRFMLNGWVDKLYVQPTFFFKYWGFSWVPVWSREGLYLHFAVVALAALGMALGLFYRVSAAVFTLGFLFIQLFDVTNYLNHYYLVVLLAGLLTLSPAGRAFSLDARFWPSWRRDYVARFWPLLFMLQLGTVYVHAGLAKAGSDWLFSAEPLRQWLAARDETPILGPLLDETWAALVMSWAGFLFDLTIAFWLSWKRSRPFAYAVVLTFHFFTSVFFEIGMFPLIMVSATTIFFAPDWPRRLLRRIGDIVPISRSEISVVSPESGKQPVRPLPRFAVALTGAYLVFQALFPLRHFAYDSDVLWSEQGMRFAWKVMIRDKSGSVTYHVRDKQSGRVWQVSPERYLTWRQAHEMSGQPDLILQLAHHIADDFRLRGHDVEVRAEAWVSFNGRPRALLVDPNVDLAAVHDGIGAASWILPAPRRASWSEKS